MHYIYLQFILYYFLIIYNYRENLLLEFMSIRKISLTEIRWLLLRGGMIISFEATTWFPKKPLNMTFSKNNLKYF